MQDDAGPTRKLTFKQRRFADAYIDPEQANGNGKLAAKLAGYKGGDNQLAVQASNNLKNPLIQEHICAALDGLTHQALQRLGEALDATVTRCFLNSSGELVNSDPVPDHRARLGAIKLVFDLRSKCASVGMAQDLNQAAGHDEGEGLDVADRALLEEALGLEAELRELGSGDAGDDQQREDGAVGDGGDE